MTKAKFFKDSDVEVDIQWYRAATDAPPLGFNSGILAGGWTDNEYDQPWLDDLGDVWNAPASYKFHGPPVGLNYDHVCGSPEDFVNGATYDPLREVKYDEQGLPLCCHAPATPLAGAIVGLELEEDVEPGQTCLTATPGEIGVPLAIVIPPGHMGWIRYPIAVPGTYHWSVNANYLGVNFAQDGPDCDNLFSLGFYSFEFTLCNTIAIPVFGPYLWVTIDNNVSGAPLELTVTVSPGACP